MCLINQDVCPSKILINKEYTVKYEREKFLCRSQKHYLLFILLSGHYQQFSKECTKIFDTF